MPGSKSMMAGPRLVIGPGPRAVEARLLEDLGDLVRAGRQDPALLARPVWVLVSSGDLRRQLATHIARSLGPGVAGVQVLTLWHAARAVLERAGLPVPRGGRVFEVLVRRAAAAEPALNGPLEAIRDGLGVAAGPTRDLLSAGYSPELHDPLADAAGELPDEVSRERALALLRVAGAVTREMARLGMGRSSDLMKRATDALRDAGPQLLDLRGLLVHGIADAPGRSLDLLEELVRTCNGTFYLDRPPDPESPARADVSCRFADHVAERLGRATQGEEVLEPPAASEVARFNAAGARSEAREVARRVRALLDQGADPESIGIVARSLQAYAAPLRTQLREQGVPFSSTTKPPPGLFPEQRAMAAVRGLMALGDAAPLDLWLDAWGAGMAQRLQGAERVPLRSADIRLGLRSLGVARCRDALQLDTNRLLDAGEDIKLPVRAGLMEAGSDGEGDADAEAAPEQAHRRRLLRAHLEAALQALREMTAHLQTWPQEAAAGAHAEAFATLLTAHLGWPGEEATAPWREAARTLQEMPRSGLVLAREEALLLLDRGLRDTGGGALGGRGAGVQVLDAAHARHLTFEHLFVMGLERDAFPRVVREDLLLPDSVRLRLSCVLPDLLPKSRGHEEERYLFVQLLAAAPRVTLSWKRSDEDGRACSPSPLLEALSREKPSVTEVPSLPVQEILHHPEGAPARRLTARESLQAVALEGSRKHFGRVLELAFEEADARWSVGGLADGDAVARLAHARLEVLEEMDPDRRTPDGRRRVKLPGPYMGYVGAVRGHGDVRQQPISATTLERLASCPWQTFLSKVLRVERPPDPMQQVPGVDPLVLGSTVHKALELLLATPEKTPPDLEGVLQRKARPITRPDPQRTWEVLEQAAREQAREAGLLLPGHVPALVRRAAPYLDSAVNLLWEAPAAQVGVLGCEVRGFLTVHDRGGRTHGVRFRADAVHHDGSAPCLLDYKTGKPLSTAKKEETRQRDHRKAIQLGTHLQAALYAAAAGENATGAYLYLHPDAEPEQALVSVHGSDQETRQLLQETVSWLLTTWRAGVFFPRVREAGKDTDGMACRFCELSDACIHPDPGTTRRLEDLAGEDPPSGEGSGSAPEPFAHLWWLGRKKKKKRSAW